MDKYIGKRLDGRYEIKELIGVGGMAYVYRANDLIGEREVAVKILKDEYLANEEFTRRFKNESRAISIMSHPNIVKVLDVNFGDRIQYIVMEYIDGITLKEYIDEKKASWQETVHFTIQTLRALQHAHDKGIIHRDIKPQNIMLLSDGTIKVTDFGIARFSRNDMRTGFGDKAIGSVHYISPEQARGARTDEKADLYSVGVMMYEMLTGKLPFEADNAVSVAIMQLQSEPKSLREIDPSIPEGLEEITLKAMQKDPEKRYQSAAEMLQDIQEFKQNPSIRFEYKYLTDDNPTKFVEAITTIKSNRQSDDLLDEEEETESRFPIIPVLMAVAAVLILVTLIIVGSVAIHNGWIFNDTDDSTFETPDFVGKEYKSITAEDTKNFTKVEVSYEYNTDYSEGFIISQDPPAKRTVKKNARVLNLTVSSGAQTVDLPEVTGTQKEEQMKSILVSKGLVTATTEQSSSTIAKGYVIELKPETQPVVKGTLIYIVISTGPPEKEDVTVDNVVGSSRDAAIQRLKKQGFKVNESKIVEKNSDSVAGTVLDQKPAAGSSAKEGTEVVLTVSSGYKDVNVYLPLPNTSSAIDLQVYINGVYSAEYSEGLQGIPGDTGSQNITLKEVRGDSYVVSIMIAKAGTKKYQIYYKYLVDPAKGVATVQEQHAFSEPTTTTKKPTTTTKEETETTTTVAEE
ncbi:MAG: Stk1 family PASTA domain-containing Ser/Thr kinase [Clostridia bacterium]|nr:Stk1 family PASTA domain-containing Ser/Thr kinase [Clostridia bacterium]